MTDYKNVMLVSPDEVKADGMINYNVDDEIIGSSIRIAQNIYLKDAIGDALVEKIQSLVYNSIIDTDNAIDDEDNVQYQVLLDDYIVPALTYRTAVEICSRISLKIRNAGVVKNSEMNVQPVDMSELIYLRDTNDTLWNDALNRMVEFICQNKESYPESDFVCGCNNTTKFARTGLWLGPNKK